MPEITSLDELSEVKSTGILLPDGRVIELRYRGEMPKFLEVEFLDCWILTPEEYTAKLMKGPMPGSDYKTFSEWAATATIDPETAKAAEALGKFYEWLLEEPEMRLPAWVAATSE